MANYDFKKDLQDGEEGEMMMSVYLSIGHGLKFVNYNKDFKYDILMMNTEKNEEVKIEVKTDYYVDDDNDTGNMAVEIRHNKKPSGISTTKSDVFLYYFRNLQRDNVWMLKSDSLRKLIKDNISSLKRVKGGDTGSTELILIPREKFRKAFFIDTVKRSKI